MLCGRPTRWLRMSATVSFCAAPSLLRVKVGSSFATWVSQCRRPSSTSRPAMAVANAFDSEARRNTVSPPTRSPVDALAKPMPRSSSTRSSLTMAAASPATSPDSSMPSSQRSNSRATAAALRTWRSSATGTTTGAGGVTSRARTRTLWRGCGFFFALARTMGALSADAPLAIAPVALALLGAGPVFFACNGVQTATADAARRANRTRGVLPKILSGGRSGPACYARKTHRF